MAAGLGRGSVQRTPVVELQAAIGTVQQRGLQDFLEIAEGMAQQAFNGIRAELHAQGRVAALGAAGGPRKHGEMLQVRFHVPAVAVCALVDGRASEPFAERAMAAVKVVAFANGAKHELS